MNVCIYSKESFASANGEHVLQNFLGARWKSHEIVNNNLQAEFGTTIDVELERAFQPIRNLFGTKGGRGESGPTLKRLPVTTGEVVDLEPGGIPRLAEPLVKVSPVDNGYQVSMQLGTIQQLGWALDILRKQRPDIKVDAEMFKQSAQSAAGRLPGYIKLSCMFGGRGYFRGLLKSCFNLLGVNNPGVALSSSCDPIRTFIKDGTGLIEDFARWIPEPQKLMIPKIGKADHFIGIMSIRGGIEGIAQLFGQIRHAVRIAEQYSGAKFSYGYIVNPFRNTDPAEARNPSFDQSAIPAFNNQHIEPSEPILATFREGCENVYEVYRGLAVQSLVQDAINEIMLPTDGKPITEELRSALSLRVAEKFSKLLLSGPYDRSV